MCNYGDDSISSYSTYKAVKMDSVRTDGLLKKYMNTDYQFLDSQLQELNQKRSHLKPLRATKWRNPSDSTALIILGASLVVLPLYLTQFS